MLQLLKLFGLISSLIILVIFSFLCKEKEHAKYVSGEVLIKFKANTSFATIDSLCKEIGLEKVKEMPQIKVTLYKIRSDMTVQEVIKKYKENPHIEYIEPNYKVKINED